MRRQIPAIVPAWQHFLKKTFILFFCLTRAQFVEPLIAPVLDFVCPSSWFQIQSGSLTCTLSCLCAVILKVMSGVTPAFSTNRGVHCISVYAAWQPSHFDPHTCSHQTYPQALVALRSEPGLEPMVQVSKSEVIKTYLNNCT